MALAGSPEVSKVDGSGTEFGASLHGGTGTWSRTLLAAQRSPVVDKGVLHISTEEIRFTGVARHASGLRG